MNNGVRDGDFDCARFTPDGVTIANTLWGDADLAIVLLDQHRRVLVSNQLAQPFLGDEDVRIGGDLEQGIRHIWLDDETEECPPERQPLARAYRGEPVHRQVIRFETATYEDQRRLCVSAVPIRLNDGSAGVVMSWQDISDRWLVQRRDRREIKLLEQLLEAASDYAIVLFDTAGRILTSSRSAQRLYGRRFREDENLHYDVLFGDQDQTEGRADAILASAAQAGSVSSEGWRNHLDGTIFWVEGAVNALLDEAGDLRGFVEIVHDVTEKRQAEQQIVSLNERLQTLNEQLEFRIADRTRQLRQQAADLKSANAELETFSYSVSHNLRAPLRAVGGYARLIEEGYAGQLPAQGLSYLHKLSASALMMGQLIDGLLALSRTQRISLDIERLDMGKLVDECWEALSDERADRIVSFTVDELPPADGDRGLIYQVWLNLLQNAIKYTSGRYETRIHVGAETCDGVTQYRVDDNGVGFEMKYAHKIGMLFQRLHDGTEFPGTGIGMASVQRIVHRHGGTIDVRGELDAGASIGFSLWSEHLGVHHDLEREHPGMLPQQEILQGGEV
jgi:PAS domain S-box-containing protein